MIQATEPASPARLQADWELDYYSRPILEEDGKKRWELLICSSPSGAKPERSFRWVMNCPASSVNSQWLKTALEQAIEQADAEGFDPPRKIRCWRSSMRTMVQRAADQLGLELVPSRRCYALVEWLQERQATVYPEEEGYLAGPLAPLRSRFSPSLFPCRRLPVVIAGRGHPCRSASFARR